MFTAEAGGTAKEFNGQHVSVVQESPEPTGGECISLCLRSFSDSGARYSRLLSATHSPGRI